MCLGTNERPHAACAEGRAFAAIRRDVRAGMSARAIERKHGVGRRTIVKAMSSAWPEPRKKLPPRGSTMTYLPGITCSAARDCGSPRWRWAPMIFGDGGWHAGAGTARSIFTRYMEAGGNFIDTKPALATATTSDDANEITNCRCCPTSCGTRRLAFGPRQASCGGREGRTTSASRGDVPRRPRIRRSEGWGRSGQRGHRRRASVHPGEGPWRLHEAPWRVLRCRGCCRRSGC